MPEEIENPEMHRVIYRCPRCKHTWAFDYEAKERRMNGSLIGYDLYRTDTEKKSLVLQSSDTQCSQCSNMYTKVNLVIGTYSNKKICDPRCTSAIGGVCSCSCGGKNHGKDWVK